MSDPINRDCTVFRQIGVCGLDVAIGMARRPFEFETPRVVGVELRGRLTPWVQAKDVTRELLRRRRVRNGLGRIFEFYGDGVVTLDVTERATICNMIVAQSATRGAACWGCGSTARHQRPRAGVAVLLTQFAP